MERKQVILLQDSKYKDETYVLEEVMIDLKRKDWLLDIIVDVRKNGIVFLNHQLSVVGFVKYEEIEYVNFSMCTRYAGGFGNAGRFGGIRVDINVDLDIALKDQSILLEVSKPISLQTLIDLLQENDVECIDMIGVIDIYKQYPNGDSREKYLRANINKIAKKYQLDHPRFKSKFK